MYRPHLPIPVRLMAGQRKALHLSFALLWGSGALWLGYHYFFSINGPFGPTPNPLEHWWLRLHGLSLMATLLAIGSVLPHHAQRAWALNKNRALGFTLLAALGWLILTGYALYYFSSDSNQKWLPLLHWIPGLALPLLLLTHIIQGRKRAVPLPHRSDHTLPAPTEAIPQPSAD